MTTYPRMSLWSLVKTEGSRFTHTAARVDARVFAQRRFGGTAIRFACRFGDPIEKLSMQKRTAIYAWSF